MRLIDTHCHLADQTFAGDLEDVAARARAAGVERALCILSADEPDEVGRADIVRGAWPDVLFAAAVHPHRAGTFAGRPADAAAVTAEVLDRVRAVAVGEIGLDYHYDFSPREVQREVFAAQASLATNRGQPVVIHTREAFDDTLAVLSTIPGVRGVLHCFTGTIAEARRGLDLGLFVSLAGIVTFPKAEQLRDLARFVPADRLLLETDAPFLAPVPYRGKRNEPAWISETFRAVAALRGMDAAALGTEVSRNFGAVVRAEAAPPTR